MKTKTIDSVLQKKLLDWADSIDDGNVRELVLRDTIITGGCITSMLLKEKVNDYDVYFRTKETTIAVAKYYLKKFYEKNGLTEFKGLNETVDASVREENEIIKIFIKSAGILSESKTDDYQYFESATDDETNSFVDESFQSIHTEDPEFNFDIENEEDITDELHKIYEENDKYRPVFISQNAITLSNKIQIVVRFYGEPEEIHENYDFVHCTNYWQSKGRSKNERLKLNMEAMECIMAKELRYVGSLYPLCSMIRTRKFLKRDWSINAGQYVKMAMQISKLDLTDLNVLKDQLIGVDTAYFAQLLGILEKQKINGTEIDDAYIISVIDKMF